MPGHPLSCSACTGISKCWRALPNRCRENTKGANGDMAVMRDETRPRQGKPLPVLHCGEVIDRPAVRAAIQKAIAALRPSYESR